MDASEIYDPEFRKLIKSKEPTIIIPVGSLEQHGAHLPVTTDSDIVTEIASSLGKKCGFIVFPTISYGVSFEHDPLFNVSMDDLEWRHYLMRIIDSIKKTVCLDPDLISNYKSIIILNGHHGNVDTLERMEDGYQQPNPEPELKLDFKDVKIDFYSYWHFMEHEFDHAGFIETSIMLAISDKVKMEKAEKGLITKGLSEKEIQRIKKLSTETGGFPKVAKNGVWGDPTGATKKDGEKFLAEIVRNLAKECQT